MTSRLPLLPWEEAWMASVFSDTDPLVNVWPESLVAAAVPELFGPGQEELGCVSQAIGAPTSKRRRTSAASAGWTEKAKVERVRELHLWLEMLLGMSHRSTIAEQLTGGSLAHEM
eukprot:5249969-Amphidinium_carterae.1